MEVAESQVKVNTHKCSLMGGDIVLGDQKESQYRWRIRRKAICRGGRGWEQDAPNPAG